MFCDLILGSKAGGIAAVDAQWTGVLLAVPHGLLKFLIGRLCARHSLLHLIVLKVHIVHV